MVSFEYDVRDRLIQETRVRQGDPDVTEYDIEYLYDDLGNRLQKSQTTATDGDPVTVVTDYVYDITEPNQEFVTKNNRLMYYTETVDSELRRTVYYTYYETGDVSNITIKDETSPNTRSDLALTYARNGGLWLAVWGDYNVDATTQEYVEDSYVPTLAREFRYESGRGRYMSRDYNTNSSADPGDWTPLTAWTYTEYLGDTPIADWEIDLDGQTNEPVWTKLRAYLPGSSSGDAAGAQLNASDDSIQYYHGDLVGSTIGTTDADGTNGVFDGPPITVAYTAFGELVANDGDDNISIGFAAPNGFPRYQYCGAWGYETGSADGSAAMLALSGHDSSLPPITLTHVGARWYDPALGRFVQRDTIGLAGGCNCYIYVADGPCQASDPSGEGLFKLIYCGNWWASDEQYDFALDGAVEALNGPAPGSSKVIAGVGGAALAQAAKLSKTDKLLDKAAVLYGGARVFRGWQPTGFRLIDDCLDAFVTGAGATTFLKGKVCTRGELQGWPGGPIEPYIVPFR